MKTTLFYLFLLSVAVGFILSTNKKVTIINDDEPKTCTTHIVSFYRNAKLDTFIDFVGIPSEMKGVIYLSGTYFEDDIIKGYFKREIKYTWTSNAHNTYFKGGDFTDNIDKDVLSDDILRNFLPEFYITPGNTIYYKVLMYSNKGWFFSVGKRPLFFCAAN